MEMTMKGTSTPGLVLLSEASHQNEPCVDVIILHISWLKAAQEWAIYKIGRAGQLGNINIYGYDVSTIIGWKTYLQLGNDLSGLLLKHTTQNQSTSDRPIILMAHSVAGFVLKQCGVTINSQKLKYQRPRDLIKAAVFMGSPHCSEPKNCEVLYTKSNAILQLSNGRQSARCEQDEALMEVCAAFDKYCGDWKILSLLEKRETRMPPSWARLRRPNTLQLVDKWLATLNANKDEKFIQINTDHPRLPSWRGSESTLQFHDEEALHEMKELVKYAQQRVTQILQRRATLTDSKEVSVQSNDHLDPDALDIALEPLIEPSVTRNPVPRKLSDFRIDISRQRTGYFHGREDVLRVLRDKLLPGNHTVVLYGKGGLGKSEVALEFVHHHRSRFDVVLWIQADSITKMRHDFGLLAAQLGLEQGENETDPYTSRELVKNWLESPIKPDNNGGSTDATWLLVFDGADKPGTLQEFIPLHRKGSILITSQDPNLQDGFRDTAHHTRFTAIPDLTSLELRQFSQDEATVVLKKVGGIEPDKENETAKRIVHLLGFMPLAIHQMAGIIRTKCWALDEFHEKYKEELIKNNLEPESAIASMRIASLNRPANALLQVCSMLDQDRIQESLFTTERDFEITLQGFPAPEDFESARTELLNASYLERNREKRELWMHNDIQEFVRGQCTLQVFGEALSAAAALVKKAWRPPAAAVRDYLKLWTPCSVYLPHVVRLQQVYFERKVPPNFAFAWLLNESASLQRNLGDTPGVRDRLDLALAICEELPKNEDDIFELHSGIYHGLGALANETNRPQDCMRYNKRYLDMRLEAEKEKGINGSERTAYAWNQHGTSYMMIRDYAEAKKMFQTSIDLYATLSLDFACPDSLPKVNLAVAKWLTGDFEDSKRLLIDGIKEREKAFGPLDSTSFRTGRFHHTLGNVLWDQGSFEASDMSHRRALKQYLNTLGQWHHRTADVRHRVAKHCIRNGEYSKAGDAIDQALAAWRREEDSFRPEIARTTFLKSIQKGKIGDEAEAQKLRKKAWKMRRKLVPDDERPPSGLIEEDFDDLVAFWSR